MPYFRNKPIWIDTSNKPRFVNKAEEKILKENNWPVGLRTHIKEAEIVKTRITERSIFFNSKFESGNLRQVFRADPRKLQRAEAFKASTPQNPEHLREVDP